MIVLDTDTCIDLLRGNKNILRRREQQEDTIGVSFMTAAELYYGVERSINQQKNFALVEQFLLSVEVLQSDISIAKRFGVLKANLESQGIPIADADTFIAATTIEKGTRLITANTRHFDRIPGLTIENWR